jgi:dimethylhistidine N-methyltransferase
LFYDEKGAHLFEEICELEEYYPTRTETNILRQNVVEIACFLGSQCSLVEFGSGAGSKTRILLEHLRGITSYIPIDISREQLFASCATLIEEFPALEVLPVAADYTADFALPRPRTPPAKTVVFFPGSTIGNFERHDAVMFLKRAAAICGADGGLLIGVDLKKEVGALEAAYNDRRGVTAAFNLNILERINRELGADFQLSAFRHQAIYDDGHGRIEMRLISLCPQTVQIGGHEFYLDESEYIITEYSHKYSTADFATLAREAGLDVARVWIDDNNRFSVQYLKPRTPACSRGKRPSPHRTPDHSRRRPATWQWTIA